MAEAPKKKLPCDCNETEDGKLDVLAIHGYRQNAETFRQKTGAFRKIAHNLVQFTYVTAPHKVMLTDDINQTADLNIGQSRHEEEYGWFFNSDDHTYRGTRQGGPAIGFEQSVRFIEEVFEKHGPFDGIFGFSQGACFVALLCDLEFRGLLKCRFNFGIMVAGYKSGSLNHLKYFTEPIKMPTLHIYGETDKVIPYEMSETLSKAFVEPAVVVHPGGHYVPAATDQKGEYDHFFRGRFFD